MNGAAAALGTLPGRGLGRGGLRGGEATVAAGAARLVPIVWILFLMAEFFFLGGCQGVYVFAG